MKQPKFINTFTIELRNQFNNGMKKGDQARKYMYFYNELDKVKITTQELANLMGISYFTLSKKIASNRWTVSEKSFLKNELSIEL